MLFEIRCSLSGFLEILDSYRCCEEFCVIDGPCPKQAATSQPRPARWLRAAPGPACPDAFDDLLELPMRCETLRLLVVAFRGRGGAVAELLMEHAEDDPVLARSLRLALAETDGADRLASEVEKRLRTLQRAKGSIDWDKVRPLARELDGLRETIAGPLAAADPHAAVAQMRRFLELAAGLFERSDDSSGSLGQVFRQAGAELGPLWALLPARDPVMVAGRCSPCWMPTATA
jgi:hypothetical protein